MVAYAQEKSDRCQMCGTAEWEWLEDPYAYEAARHTCFGCQKKDILRDDEDGKQPGVSIVLLPKRIAKAIRQRRESKRNDGER